MNGLAIDPRFRQAPPSGSWVLDTRRELHRREWLLEAAAESAEVRALVMHLCRASYDFWLQNFVWLRDPTRQGWDFIPARADWDFQRPLEQFALGLSPGSRQTISTEAIDAEVAALEDAAASGDQLALRLLESGQTLESQRRSFLLEKSRNVGASVTATRLATWEFLFVPMSSNIFVSLKREKVDDNSMIFDRSLFGKIRRMIHWCPEWMRPSTWRGTRRARFDDNAMMLVNPDNGASITGQSTDPDAIRGERAGRVWIDEANSIPWFGDLLTAAREVGPFGALSSVAGRTTDFALLRHGELGIDVVPYGEHLTKRGVVIFRHHYSMRPDRDPATPLGKAWMDATRPEYTDEGWAQEMELDYAASTPGRIWPMFDRQRHVLTHAEWREVDDLRRRGDLVEVEGWDFGGSRALTAVVWGWFNQRTGQLFLDDSMQWANQTVEKVAADYHRRRGGTLPDISVGDIYAGGRGKSTQGGRVLDPVRSWIRNLRDYGITVRGQTLEVESAIELVAKGLNHDRIMLSPHACARDGRLPSLAECMDQYSRDVKAGGDELSHVGNVPKPHKGVHSHAADAVQHIAWRVLRGAV